MENDPHTDNQSAPSRLKHWLSSVSKTKPPALDPDMIKAIAQALKDIAAIEKALANEDLLLAELRQIMAIWPERLASDEDRVAKTLAWLRALFGPGAAPIASQDLSDAITETLRTAVYEPRPADVLKTIAAVRARRDDARFWLEQLAAHGPAAWVQRSGSWRLKYDFEREEGSEQGQEGRKSDRPARSK